MRPGVKAFYKACPKRFGLSIWSPMPIQWYENLSGCDTGRLPVTEVTIWQIVRTITLN